MISTQELSLRESAMRADLAAKRTELDEAALAAVTDESLAPVRDRLRNEVRSIEDNINDLEGARRAAAVEEAKERAAMSVERRKAAYATAVAKCGEVVDLAGELDEAVEQIRTLFTRIATVNAAMKQAVGSAAERGNARRNQDLMYLTAYSGSKLDDFLRNEQGRRAFVPHFHSTTGLALHTARTALEIDTIEKGEAA